MEILAKEIIKPSSPTPQHLRTLKLSFLDQKAPPIYIPLINFYEASQIQAHDDHQNHAQISQLLKQSLSKALTRFYPLAGRISTEGFVIDCNDSGALFIQAHVHTDILQVVDKPNMEELREYLPKIELSSSQGSGGVGEKENVLLAVQINFFDCGGIAIGVKISHKIADGPSLVTFMNGWSTICRGDENIPESSFSMQNLFPPRDLSSFGFRSNIGITKEKIVTKRFLFNKEKMSKLKESASSAAGSKVKDPTRVEVVSAFIWRKFIEMQKAKITGTEKMVAALHAVNLRPRTDPVLPDQTFGNVWWHTIAIPISKEESEDHNLIGELRSSIRNINSNYVKKLQNEGEYIKILKKSVDLYSKGEIELFNFSSWCRFPVYEVDYGWGKPIWVCTTTLPFKNVAILMSTKNGDDIEAWINMLEGDATALEDGLLSN